MVISWWFLEKLFKILDMYEILWDLLFEIEEIFSGEVCVGLWVEVVGILMWLGECVWGMFVDFESVI